MQIILLEQITGLGKLGETVDVKSGYARNFLIPQKKALPATKANIAKFEDQRKELEKREAAHKAEAAKEAAKFDGIRVVLERQASETGQLFGSVKPLDIVRSLEEQKLTIEKQQVQLGEPIKLVGEHSIRIALHPEVLVDLPVEVQRSATV